MVRVLGFIWFWGVLPVTPLPSHLYQCKVVCVPLLEQGWVSVIVGWLGLEWIPQLPLLLVEGQEQSPHTHIHMQGEMGSISEK